MTAATTAERWLGLLLSGFCLLILVSGDGLCGRYQRQCAPNATCVNDRTCLCVEPLVGEPLVECRLPGEFQCVLKSDPHLRAFGGAKANLNLPCKYRMTRVQTNLKGAVPGLAFCSFEVFGFNEVINGKYYTSGVEVSFAIGDFANQYFRQEDVIKFDVNQDGVQSSTGEATKWGHGTHSSFQGVEVSCTFDHKNRFVTLDIPRCHFRVKFRPFNPEEPQGPQSQVPAVSIVAGPDTIFGETELGRYPLSVCGEAGRQGDGEDLYTERARFLHVSNMHEAILLDVLNQNITQESLVPEYTSDVLQDKEQCQQTVDEFLQCPDLDAKAKAVQLCGRILFKRRLGKCLGIAALRAFRGCVTAVCSEDKIEGCAIYHEEFDSRPCNGPHKINEFCKPE